MLNRRYFIALGVVVVMTLVLLKLPIRATNQLKLALSGFFLPLHGLFSSGGRLGDKAANAVVSKTELVRQLEKSERENQELKIRLGQADELARENARLRQYLAFPKQPGWKLKLVRVVGRDPANWWRTMRVDAGTRDGVIGNLPVLTADGLVGRVGEVSYTESQVILLGDPACRVAAMIEEPPREHGVIAPASPNPFDNTLVDLSYLSRNSKLSPGQRVITSGIGGVFPKGILIGQVVDSKSVGYGLYNEARVKVEVRMNTLEEVWIKMP